MTEPPKSRGLRLRPMQVLATALAALTGAYLASRLGVYGTVVGAGVISVLSTVATEVYVRSLDRTKDAAIRGTALVKLRGPGIDTTAPAHVEDAAVTSTARPARSTELEVLDSSVPDTSVLSQVHDTAELSAVEPPGPGTAGDESAATDRPRRLRWPMVAAGSLAAFALAMVAITGLEATTGSRFSGGTGSTLGALVVPDRTVEPSPDEMSDDTQRSEDGSARAPSEEPSTPSPTPTPGADPGPATESPEDTGAGVPAPGDTETPAETETPEPTETPSPSETSQPTEPADEPSQPDAED